MQTCVTKYLKFSNLRILRNPENYKACITSDEEI